ncbi:hypothetical protein MPER_05860, partial [Moniliophthora perniciosa FA553]
MGALFIGVLLAAALWGVTSVQTWTYYADYSASDPLRLKIMVAVTYGLDTTHQIMLSHLLYTYLVSNFANPLILGELAFIAVIVQLFLTWRVWILSHKNVPVIVIILLLVFAEFGVTIALLRKVIDDMPHVISRVVNALGAASDIAITISLSFYLYTSKSRMKNTDAIMDQLILFCVRTGLLTT